MWLLYLWCPASGECPDWKRLAFEDAFHVVFILKHLSYMIGLLEDNWSIYRSIVGCRSNVCPLSHRKVISRASKWDDCGQLTGPCLQNLVKVSDLHRHLLPVVMNVRKNITNITEEHCLVFQLPRPCKSTQAEALHVSLPCGARGLIELLSLLFDRF